MGLRNYSEYLRVWPFPNIFFYLFTLTHPSGEGLTTGCLSFWAHVNRKVFLLYEESFHNFNPVYFKAFGALGTIPFWETKEGELNINCYWNKNFESPRINEDNLMPEEQAVVEFFLMSFGKKYLNLKGIVSGDAKVIRKYLGFLFSFSTFPLLSSLYSIINLWSFCRQNGSKVCNGWILTLHLEEAPWGRWQQ